MRRPACLGKIIPNRRPGGVKERKWSTQNRAILLIRYNSCSAQCIRGELAAETFDCIPHSHDARSQRVAVLLMSESPNFASSTSFQTAKDMFNDACAASLVQAM